MPAIFGRKCYVGGRAIEKRGPVDSKKWDVVVQIKGNLKAWLFTDVFWVVLVATCCCLCFGCCLLFSVVVELVPDLVVLFSFF